MTYESRIPAESSYLLALGRAFYNFTYLEWIVVWTIVKLAADGFGGVPKRRPSRDIAKALTTAINETEPPLPKTLRVRLLEFAAAYREAIKSRNNLLHAHPSTAADGTQLLGSPGIQPMVPNADILDLADLATRERLGIDSK